MCLGTIIEKESLMKITLKNVLTLFCYLVSLCATVEAIDLNNLEHIGPVVSFSQTGNAITFNCQDQSQVRVMILASDLVRIRVAYRKSLPVHDHSWAIAKQAWDAPRWQINERADAFLISTDELEVVVHRSPLLIEFHDA